MDINYYFPFLNNKIWIMPNTFLIIIIKTANNKIGS